MRATLTKRQKEVYDVLEKAIRTSTICPSYAELAKALDLRVSNVYRIISILISKGFVKKINGLNRSFILTETENERELSHLKELKQTVTDFVFKQEEYQSFLKIDPKSKKTTDLARKTGDSFNSINCLVNGN